VFESGNKLRILHITHRLDVGGVGTMILDLARAQEQLGHSVTVCTMYGPDFLDEQARGLGLTVVNLKSAPNFVAKTRSLWTYLREHPQDIVHSHWHVWLPTAFAGFLRRTRCIHTHHSNQSRRRFIEDRAALLFTSRVIILTPEIDDYIRKWVGVPKRKIVVISNGISLGRVQGAGRVEIEGINPESTTIGMIARISPPKDHLTFMHAAKIVLARHPKVHFIAVGDGRQRAELEAEKGRLQIPNFHFLGDRPDVPAILRRLTINVLATRREGLSITLLEAMASGCPCIASDIPANRFALDSGKSGLLVPGGNPEALAAAIERLLADAGLREEFIEHARQRSSYFTVERMAQEYLDLCAQLLP
jgi:glycosyltransferase involved in cell wall biosynthesis